MQTARMSHTFFLHTLNTQFCNPFCISDSTQWEVWQVYMYLILCQCTPNACSKYNLSMQLLHSGDYFRLNVCYHVCCFFRVWRLYKVCLHSITLHACSMCPLLCFQNTSPATPNNANAGMCKKPYRISLLPIIFLKIAPSDSWSYPLN